MNGKCLNAGQICLAPDYILVPFERRAELVEALRAAVAALYPTLRNNPDYTSIVNTRHRQRLEAYLEDARTKGGVLVELNPASESFTDNKMPPTLVLDPTEDMLVSREEIFGPILPIETYGRIDEAIARVNAGERPLGLYYFGPDEDEREQVLSRTTSGGVTVNDVAVHALEEDLPFGGVGSSGMGHYRGRDGFRRFSHARAVFTQAPIDVAAVLRPPYGTLFRKMVGSLVKR
jgi:coniferyl-aldehyde dehydrogenase